VIPLNSPSLGPAEEAAILDAFRSGWVTLGKYVTQFERDFAAYVGRKYAVACSSGTAALWLAIKALQLPAGQRIAAGSFVCDAVANAAIHATGRAPYVVDVEPDTWSTDLDALAAALVQAPALRIGAVVLAHTYGVMARDSLRLEAACARLGLPLLEDGSEAHGARLHGRQAGSLGIATIFSCRGEKLISGGQLGVVVTDDAVFAQRVHQLVHCGLPVDRLRFWSTVPGMNFQPSHLNAALACAQLGRVDELIKARNAVHAGWVARLGQFSGITFQGVVGEPAYWLHAIRITREFTGLTPADLALGLLERGIETRPGFYPLNLLPHVEAAEPCPVAERLLREILVLPSGPGITPAQQDEVVATILEITGRA
jgi:perosamine synthetase